MLSCNLKLAANTASVALSRRLSPNKRAFFSSSKVCLFPQFSPSTRTGSLINQSKKSVVCALRSDQTMASQSKKRDSIYDLTVKDARGNEVDLSTYKGKVLLIVNVASECGLANTNYTEMNQLYQKYKDQGLEILAFPCNQFGNEEPGTMDEILEYVSRFKVEFPIFNKIEVNGESAHPLYKFLKASKGGLFGDGIKWNFSKFLVDREGHVVDRFAPTTSPLSFESEVKKVLGIS